MNVHFLGDLEGVGDFSRCIKLVSELSELSVVVSYMVIFNTRRSRSRLLC